MKYFVFLFLVAMAFSASAQQIPAWWDYVDCVGDDGEIADENVCHHMPVGDYDDDEMEALVYECWEGPIPALSYWCEVSFVSEGASCSGAWGQVMGDMVGPGITCEGD